MRLVSRPRVQPELCIAFILYVRSPNEHGVDVNDFQIWLIVMVFQLFCRRSQAIAQLARCEWMFSFNLLRRWRNLWMDSRNSWACSAMPTVHVQNWPLTLQTVYKDEQSIMALTSPVFLSKNLNWRESKQLKTLTWSRDWNLKLFWKAEKKFFLL